MAGVPMVRYLSAETNLVFHGNSLVSGPYVASPFPARVQTTPPVNNQVTCINRGSPGSKWSDLMGEGVASIDPLFVAGKHNVLVVWEGTNTIKNNGYNGTACYNNAANYTAARLAAREWIIVHMTMIPCRYSTFTDANADSVASATNTYNDLLRANWRGMGAKALVDLGQIGSPFVPPSNNSTTAFSAMTYNGSPIWTPSEAQWVHLNDNGYAAVAALVSATLMRLRAR